MAELGGGGQPGGQRGRGEEVGDRVAWALCAPAAWGSSLSVITRDWTQIGHGRE